MEGEYYPEPEMADCAKEVTLRQPTLQETIAGRLKKAREEVSRLEELSTLLAQNPEVNRIIELIGKRHL